MTRLEAIINFMKNAGYEVSVDTNSEDINVSREIEVKYADFKNAEFHVVNEDASEEYVRAKKGTYNSETKTVVIEECFHIYINGKNKEVENPEEYAAEKLTKMSAVNTYLMNAIKYKK